ncbi:MAG: hypothetical protein ACFFDN_45530 [Candidatus Hodarchaeota archaeon]
MIFQLYGWDLVAVVTFIIIFIIVFLLISTISLIIGLSVVKSKFNDFGSVFITALYCALVGWIPCLGCILSVLIVRARHDTGFFAAIVVLLIAFLFGFLLTYLIFIILF